MLGVVKQRGLFLSCRFNVSAFHLSDKRVHHYINSLANSVLRDEDIGTRPELEVSPLDVARNCMRLDSVDRPSEGALEKPNPNPSPVERRETLLSR